MPLTVAVQMDPIANIRVAGDSTFALLLEAQARGCRLLHYTPDRLRLSKNRVEAMAEPLEVKDVAGDHARLGEPLLVDLSTVDVVLLRQDPPFDLAYITTTISSSASSRARSSSTTRAASAICRKSCSSWTFPLSCPRP